MCSIKLLPVMVIIADVAALAIKASSGAVVLQQTVQAQNITTEGNMTGAGNTTAAGCQGNMIGAASDENSTAGVTAEPCCGKRRTR